jgi:hypothetical protein
MTAPRCISRLYCEHRGKDGLCNNPALVLTGWDAHCSLAEQNRIHEWKMRVERAEDDQTALDDEDERETGTDESVRFRKEAE